MTGQWIWTGAAAGAVLSLIVAGAAHAAAAPYPAMAPRVQYMMERPREIALALSAAPASIASDASVLVLGAHGFETAITGTGQFTCLVERAWDKPFADPEFWNPKMRGPVCMNAAAARSVLPIYLERARWVLSGLPLAAMKTRTRNSDKAHTPPAAGAMAFMLSKAQYLSDAGRSWHPHVMFYAPVTDPAAWGANLKGSPVLGATDPDLGTTIFVLVRKWSDGTLADYDPPTQPGAHHH